MKGILKPSTDNTHTAKDTIQSLFELELHQLYHIRPIRDSISDRLESLRKSETINHPSPLHSNISTIAYAMRHRLRETFLDQSLTRDTGTNNAQNNTNKCR